MLRKQRFVMSKQDHENIQDMFSERAFQALNQGNQNLQSVLWVCHGLSEILPKIHSRPAVRASRPCYDDCIAIKLICYTPTQRTYGLYSLNESKVVTRLASLVFLLSAIRRLF